MAHLWHGDDDGGDGDQKPYILMSNNKRIGIDMRMEVIYISCKAMLIIIKFWPMSRLKHTHTLNDLHFCTFSSLSTAKIQVERIMMTILIFQLLPSPIRIYSLSFIFSNDSIVW